MSFKTEKGKEEVMHQNYELKYKDKFELAQSGFQQVINNPANPNEIITVQHVH